MALYDDLQIVSYAYPALNFVSGAGTYKLPIPRTASFARVMDILLVSTTTFTQTTTGAVVQIGDGTTANAFAALAVGGLTAGNSISGRDLANGTWINNYIAGQNLAVGTAGVLHDLIMTIVAPTGGTPAGVGNLTVVVGYDTINR